MNAVNHTEHMPPPYLVRKEVDRFADLLKQLQESKDRAAQNFTVGVAQGWRESFWWRVRHGAALIAFGVCVGITLAILVAPMLAWWLS